MIVLGVIDKALDIIGLCTVVYWTVKGTLYFTRPRKSKVSGPQNLNK